MESLTELYRIGRGPSSSHTMGPDRAARYLKAQYPDADTFIVTLKGSLAKTGKGHLTDKAIEEALYPKNAVIIWDKTGKTPHPNMMHFCITKNGNEIAFKRVFSVGGGKFVIEGEKTADPPDVYPQKNFEEIKEYCTENGIRLWEYVERYEGREIWDYLAKVWNTMRDEIARGLDAEGTLQGSLQLQRKAHLLYSKCRSDDPGTNESRLVSSCAFAASEENASGGVVVTSPTCGSCGVVPAVLLYNQEKLGLSDSDVIKALAAGGVIGNVIKTNASISGAECGCQAEIGSACSMAAAALAELQGMDIDQIEYSAEIALEHHLGLTCDPVDGLVQIPCIERNAVAAMRAINAVDLARFLNSTRKVSFDMVVNTMYKTGRDLFSKYRETSEGGLAEEFKRDDDFIL